MENKKTYEKPEMEIMDMQFCSELLVESCGGVPCPEGDVEIKD